MLKLILSLVLLAGPALARSEQVTLGGRSYVIHLPDGVASPPLIVALHGGGGSPEQFASSSGLARDATRAGYAVAFPAGTGRRGGRLFTWNGGYCCGPAARNGVDDLGFLSDVIADAARRFGAGGDVYLTGMSNGSILAETYAATYPKRIKAVAGVAGTMDVARTRPKGAVPLLIIHGTDDTMVPYFGGKGDTSLTRTNFASVDAVAQAFLARWPAPLTKTARQIDRVDDGTSVIVADHATRGRVVLRVQTVVGGAHHWPGGRKARLTDGKTAEIDANTEILRFFALHP